MQDLHCKEKIFECQKNYDWQKETEHYKPVSRIRRFRSWLAWHGLSYGDLAKELGVTRQLICQIVNGNRASTKRIEQLKSVGVPEDLLPNPIDFDKK